MKEVKKVETLIARQVSRFRKPIRTQLQINSGGKK